MLRWLQDFLRPSEEWQSDYDYVAYKILFEDLDHNKDGVLDVLELGEGLKNWSSSFGVDPEKVSHPQRVCGTGNVGKMLHRAGSQHSDALHFLEFSRACGVGVEFPFVGFFTQKNIAQ